MTTAIIYGWLIRLALRWFGERFTVIWGHVFDMITFGLLAFMTSGTLALILMPLAARGAVVSPRAAGDHVAHRLQRSAGRVACRA